MADLLSYLRCVAQVWETYDSQGSDYAYSISPSEVPHRAITCLKKRMVLNPRFDWFLSDELITKIIPHTPIDSIPGAVSDSESSEESTQKDIFWQIYDELQREEELSNYSEIDKVTVSGKKLEERLISTGEFYNGDAARMIREMVRIGILEEVMLGTYRKVIPQNV